MSGKAYTMREMKSIVDYLVEHKAYGETKGRKMWVTFASSQMTTRTWQSLKETFLKRILPDIQNPYYKLTMEQVRSFKQGHDVEARKNNKLELETVSDESTSNGQKDTNGEKATSILQEADQPSGEDIKPASVTRNRSSVDTLILDDPYYSNAEEIQNVLENTTESDINEDIYKPLKDCLTFEQSEPFNIDAMKVLEDFATDSEGSDKGLRMDIDENPPEANNKENETEELIEIPHTEDIAEVPINPIEAEVNVMEFGKETEDSTDQLAVQIPDENEAVSNENQTDADQNAPIINEEPVVISDQSDINNDESEVNNKEIEADISNPNIDSALDTSEVNIDHAKKTKTTEEKQDKVVENDKDKDVEEIVQMPTTLSETKSPTKVQSPETVQVDTEKTVNDEENLEKITELPKKVRISDPVPNSNTTVNTSSNITDSLIPNNQEALNEIDTQTKQQGTQDKPKNTRKRSTSRESGHNKKFKLDKTDVNNKEGQLDKEKTDMRKMESEDLFAHANSQQNKDTNQLIEAENAETETNENVENETVENIENDEAQNNPCLKSVSLFAEQFNTTKLLESESEDESIEQSDSKPKLSENKSKEPVASKPSENNSNKLSNTSKQSKNTSSSKIEFSKDPIVLKSHSESDDNNKPKANVSTAQKTEKVKEKVRKESLLANMLGFGGNVSRKRRMSHRRSRTNRHSMTIPSDSSEWTSESDDEYISPPRGRRNRQTRKYLKPKSGKILALNEEGGLFIMNGKKIYPLVKDGRNIKNYLNYHVDSDSEEEDHSYWRQKYVQEKIRADELEKRLRSKEARSSERSDVHLERKSPILQTNTTLRNPSSKNLHNESVNKVFAANDKGKEPVKSTSASSSQEKLKICFTRNNQEVQLEGYWPQIHPALQQVVELLHTDEDSNGKSKSSTKPIYNKEESNEKKSDVVEMVDIDSGKTTPIIPTVDAAIHEKVSKIENEIFKEIEKRAKEEEPKLSETENVNVNKRARGRPSNSELSVSKTGIQPEKSRPATRQSRKSSKNEKLDVSSSKQDLKEVLNPESVQKEESSSKSIQKEDSTTKELRKRDSTVSKQVEKSQKSNESVSKMKKPEVMKRPSRAPKRLVDETPEQNRMSTRRSTSGKSNQIDDDETRYKLPPNKKAKKPTVNTKKSSQPAQNPDDTSLRSIESGQGYQDSDPSPINTKRKKKLSFKVNRSKKHVKRISLPNLTEIFSSDSSNSAYFIPLKKSLSTLNSAIYKTDSYELLMPKEKALKLLDPINEDLNSDEVRHFNSINDKENKSTNSNIMIEICSSSNVSLPASPELSVVENLTMSREMIKPNISLNEIELNKINSRNLDDVNSKYDQYMISNIDVSCPLMEQECGLQNSNVNADRKSVSESLINKAAEQKSISETINKKLHDLLLESAKKISNRDEKMDVDETVKKAKPKKRSSTPRKRKTAKKTAQVNSFIEEEVMETCSYAGRNSCPPVITVLPPDENANFAKTPAEKANKKKKDVIKVKILRPKSRTRKNSISKNSTKSTITDSGINDPDNFSGMFLKGNDSVDLIHNHSDTCLNANECINDNSIEFIENSVKSVISLNSNSSDSELKRLMGSAEKSMDTLSNDAQDISAFSKLLNPVEEIFRSPTVNHSPVVSNSSLITEDLSNSPQSSKWFLLSEDDTNTVQEVRSFGSNLNHIFTTCAVPNLSTITEGSVDSRKFKDGDAQNCDSQSLF